MLGIFLYPWLKFLHVASVLGFVLFHGVSILVAIRLFKERDRTRIAELLQFSGSAVRGMYVSLLLLIAFGVWTGFQIHVWSFWWIWIAIVLLAATAVEMWVVAAPYYRDLKDAIQLRPSGVPRKSDEELDELLRSRAPMFNAAFGLASLTVITWLMVYKPTWQI
jgi:hypothetical protein